MEMYKGTLYTIMGVDGFTVSRTDGVNVKFDAESFKADGIDLDAEEEIANLVMNDLDGFLNDGLDVVVSIERDTEFGYETDGPYATTEDEAE